MSLLCLILAGGKSTRKGQDKALLYDSTNILSKKLEALGCRVLIACGSRERAHHFDSNCWFDPSYAKSLGEVIYAFVAEHDEEVQLFPCDMYRLDDAALATILAQSPGVPLDSESNEQFTLTRIPVQPNLPKAMSLGDLFSGLERNNLSSLGNRLENFNHPDQIDDLSKSDQ